MQRVASAEEMRWCDETTIKTYGVPSLLLMENAGRSVAVFADGMLGPLRGKHVVIFCGKGNNGGDGFVAARHSANLGADVTLLLLSSPSELKGDAKTNYDIIRKFARDGSNSIVIKHYSRKILDSLTKPDVIVDAIFGTGFSGGVRRPYSDAIRWMNEHQAPVIAVDLPSGVDASTGVVENHAVLATATVTFGLPKIGLLCNRGKETSGKIHIADIGTPKSVTNSRKLATFLVQSSDVRQVLPKRSVHAHKYSVGKIFVLAGSKGLTGAAAMCSTAALRSGAGAVILGTPESVYPILARKTTEVMVKPLPSTGEGTLSLAGYTTIQEDLSWANVVLIGPGLSQNNETQEVILRVLEHYKGKILIDADALTAIASAGVNRLRKLKAESILTPHVGEFSRLTKVPSEEIEAQRVEVARGFSRKYGVTLVLKGVPTATSAMDGKVYLNATGNPGMATAGSGDVLSGVIAGLWAQGMSAREAAYAGVYLHGLSGDLAREKFGERSIVATDLIESLSEAFHSVEIEGAR